MKPVLRPLAGLFFLSLPLLLGGCLTLEVHTRLRPDGSAERTVTVAVDEVLLQGAAADPIAALHEAAVAAGWRAEPYRDERRGERGVRLSRTASALEDLGRLSATDPLAGLERIALEAGEPSRVTVTLSIAGVLERLRQAAGEPPLSPEDRTLLQAADLRLIYTLEVPGVVFDYAPRDLARAEGGRVRWEVPLTPDRPEITLMARWRPVASGPFPPLCAGGLGLLLGLAVGIGAIRGWR